jgi:hypothetical protein
MENTLSQLQSLFPQLKFTAGKSFSWSPETGEIFYDEARKGRKPIWSLLHETGHALLGHRSYEADFELIRLEVAAWEKAKEIGARLSVTINEDHIQDCLDTYRDWLYKRSICPTCATKALQQEDYAHYRCFNCHTTWRVTPSRFCRAYRSTEKIKKPSAVFHLTDGF